MLGRMPGEKERAVLLGKELDRPLTYLRYVATQVTSQTQRYVLGSISVALALVAGHKQGGQKCLMTTPSPASVMPCGEDITSDLPGKVGIMPVGEKTTLPSRSFFVRLLAGRASCAFSRLTWAEAGRIIPA
jgi:hypothetical protein